MLWGGLHCALSACQFDCDASALVYAVGCWCGLQDATLDAVVQQGTKVAWIGYGDEGLTVEQWLTRIGCHATLATFRDVYVPQTPDRVMPACDTHGMVAPPAVRSSSKRLAARKKKQRKRSSAALERRDSVEDAVAGPLALTLTKFQVRHPSQAVLRAAVPSSRHVRWRAELVGQAPEEARCR